MACCAWCFVCDRWCLVVFVWLLCFGLVVGLVWFTVVSYRFVVFDCCLRVCWWTFVTACFLLVVIVCCRGLVLVVCVCWAGWWFDMFVIAWWRTCYFMGALVFGYVWWVVCSLVWVCGFGGFVAACGYSCGLVIVLLFVSYCCV